MTDRQNIAATIAAAVAAKTPSVEVVEGAELKCKWEMDKKITMYRTDCKHRLPFLGKAGFAEFKFCPFCGRSIKR